MLNINDILDRIKKYLEIDTDAELARSLGVTPQRLRNWRTPGRGTVPWEVLCEFAMKHGMSFDWLLTGVEKNISEGGSSGTLADVIKFIPPEVLEVFRSDDEELKELILDLIAHLKLKKRFIVKADAYGANEKAGYSLKWPSQDDESMEIDIVLDKNLTKKKAM